MDADLTPRMQHMLTKIKTREDVDRELDLNAAAIEKEERSGGYDRLKISRLQSRRRLLLGLLHHFNQPRLI